MKLTDTFAVLTPRMDVATVPVTPTVYQELDSRFDGFRGHALVAVYTFDRDWGNWERHPNGDEIVVLLAGATDMVLRRDTGDEVVTLSAPESCVVIPRNTWHTARVREPTRMLFVTPGEGTEHADAP